MAARLAVRRFDDMTRLRVLIAGGGVAALEALIALHAHAGDRVDITLVAPDPDFTYRPLSVTEPFCLGRARHYPLRDIAEEFGARLVQDTLAAVDTEARVASGAGGGEWSYDVLLVAVGARARPAYAGVITLTQDGAGEALAGLLADLEQGYVRRVAFVVPPGVAWTLPLYELAILTARDVWAQGIDRAELSIVTPEERPLALFGADGSDAVAAMLVAERIRFVGSAYTHAPDGELTLQPGGQAIEADRVVALPALDGRPIRGLPADPAGFLPVDAFGRVQGIDAVYGAGDGTSFPIKQGGLAAQQADAVAEVIAALAGADIEPHPWRPVLRGKLITGGDDRYLRHAVGGGGGEPSVRNAALWWPPTKIASRYLGPYLFEADEAETIERIGSHEVELLGTEWFTPG
jgi:sulfide:quinone oxidoreductase